mmetsp:Transcript_15226/g.20409  ORF Transcript_15226/g.20409 Transcript_15226/m.20409 type:complete len:221 (+) Transcript_15226:844-1506(+)
MDEPLERIEAHAPSDGSLDGREPGVIPARHQLLVHKILEFALGEDGADEVELGEGLNPDLPYLHGILEPCVLEVAVVVLRRAQGMGDSFDRVHDWARQVVRGVGLERGARAVMWRLVRAVKYRIPHGAVVRLHIDLSTQAPVISFWDSSHHLIEPFRGRRNIHVPMLGVGAGLAHILHGLCGGVVHVGVAICDKLPGVLLDGLEVVRRERPDVCLHTQRY